MSEQRKSAWILLICYLCHWRLCPLLPACEVCHCTWTVSFSVKNVKCGRYCKANPNLPQLKGNHISRFWMMCDTHGAQLLIFARICKVYSSSLWCNVPIKKLYYSSSYWPICIYCAAENVRQRDSAKCTQPPYKNGR